MTATTSKRTTRRISGRRMTWETPWLTITLFYTDGTTDVTVYRVEERGSDAGRSFDLTRWTRPGEHGVTESHRVDLAGNGQQACTCPANAFKQNCKHCDAMRKLLDTGRIAGGYPAAE